MAAPPPTLHRDLDELLRRLETHRAPTFTIGPQERIDAHLALLALAGDGSAAIGDYGDHLAPLLARSPAQRGAFESIIAALASTTETPHVVPPGMQSPPESPPEPPPPPRWRELFDTPGKRVSWIATLVLLAVAIWFWTRPVEEDVRPQSRSIAASNPTSLPVTAPTPVPIRSADDPNTLSRLLYAADKHDTIPTLREIGRRLGPTARVRMTPDDYLRRLRALTGLPADRPLMLVPPGGTTPARNDAVTLVWAIGQIEQPGRADSWDDVALRLVPDAVGLAVSALQGGARTNAACAYLRKEQGWTNNLASDATTATVVEAARKLPGAAEAIGGDDDAIVARCAAALQPGWRPPDAPWLPQPPPEPTGPPAWVAWAMAAAVLATLVVALLPLLDPRRAFLRRRPPRAPPERSRLLRDRPGALLGDAHTLAQTRKALQRREPRHTRALDIRRTIGATIRAGGRVVPLTATVRSAPDYLVLIERAGLVDLEADRAAALIAPLRTAAIGVDLFWFTEDPSRVQPEGGGPAVPIEALMARFPNHRLLLIGAGEHTLDLFSGRLRGGYARLAHWRRRGLLTPIPRGEWAREERLIASGLQAPVGRATADGLLALAQRLLDETAGSQRLLVAGDEGATPLPRGLARLLRDPAATRRDADVAWVEELVTELSWYPDGPGFEWLCALAVYPAPTFDLAVHLGLHLPELSGGSERRLYTPSRLAALTRLPWLREGRVPDPVRRALIARLSPARAAEVRALLLALIGGADPSSGAAAAGHATFGRDRGPDPVIARLLDDEVLVDFLAQGEVGDLEVVLPRRERPTFRQRLRDADWLAIGAMALTGSYALATWYAAPRSGRAGLEAWLPLLATLAAAAATLAVLRPKTLWLGVRRVLPKLATWGVQLALVAVAALLGAFKGDNAYAILEFAAVIVMILLWPASRAIATEGAGPLLRSFGVGNVAPPPLRVSMPKVKDALAATTAFPPVLLAASEPENGRAWLLMLAGMGALLPLAAARLPAAPRLVPEPDLARLRAAPAHRRAIPFALGALLLAGCLWLAWHTHGSLHRFPPTASERLVAVNGTLIATTVGDGRTITVIDSGDPGTELARFTLPRTEQQFGVADPLARLAVGRAGDTIRVAASTAGGCILHFFSGGRVASSYEVPAVRPAMPPMIAFDPAGRSLELQHAADGALVAGGSRTDGSKVEEEKLEGNTARPTALAAVGNRSFVWAHSDGRFGAMIRLEGASALRPKIISALPSAARLAGGARIIRPLGPQAYRVRFLALADDGSAVIGSIGGPEGLRITPAPPISALRVGPVVPWREAPRPVPLSEIRPEPVQRARPAAASAKTRPFKALVSGRITGKSLGSIVPPRSEPIPADPNEDRSVAPMVRIILGMPQTATSSAVAAALEEQLPGSTLTTPERQAAFLAAIMRESGLARLEENLNYSAAALQRVWPRLFTDEASTIGYAGRPERIANRVYASRVGNGNESSGDGWRYRGRGLLQTTGRERYRQLGAALAVDLLRDPDRLTDPQFAVRAALTEWESRGYDRYADSGDLIELRRSMTGGTVGMDAFKSDYASFLATLKLAARPASAN